jgi:uncharacterized protein (TIGR04255 family)
MFESVSIPKKLANSPINEAIFEIRYDGDYPGEALYGLLFDIFKQFPNKDMAELPIMQLPKQIRDNDPNLRYQPFYSVSDNKFAFSIGPHSIVFSSLKPYGGWEAWNQFFAPIIATIQAIKIIKKVERIGLRYFNLFEVNIFDHINAELTLEKQIITTSPCSFHMELDNENIHIILNVGNATNIKDVQTHQSLIDIDCIRTLDCSSEQFFSSYKAVIEETHEMNERVFFGLLKENFLNTFNPEY